MDNTTFTQLVDKLDKLGNEIEELDVRITNASDIRKAEIEKVSKELKDFESQFRDLIDKCSKYGITVSGDYNLDRMFLDSDFKIEIKDGIGTITDSFSTFKILSSQLEQHPYQSYSKIANFDFSEIADKEYFLHPSIKKIHENIDGILNDTARFMLIELDEIKKYKDKQLASTVQLEHKPFLENINNTLYNMRLVAEYCDKNDLFVDFSSEDYSSRYYIDGLNCELKLAKEGLQLSVGDGNFSIPLINITEIGTGFVNFNNKINRIDYDDSYNPRYNSKDIIDSKIQMNAIFENDGHTLKDLAGWFERNSNSITECVKEYLIEIDKNIQKEQSREIE